MANKVTYAIKIKAIIALAMPLLYFLMFLPIWNENELKIIPIDVIDIIQIASLLIAVINLYLSSGYHFDNRISKYGHLSSNGLLRQCGREWTV